MHSLADDPPQAGQEIGKALCMGQGTRLLAKTGWLENDNEAYRSAMQKVPLYSRALTTGLPFPKTRRIVFLNGQPRRLDALAIHVLDVYNWLLGYTSMRTNIVIDDKLMRDALRATGLKTKREAVEQGLRTLLRLSRQAGIR